MNQVQGFIELCDLPENDKIAITNEFGSLVELYITICNLSNQRIQNIITQEHLQNQLLLIEDQLDTMDLSIEGDEIISNISNDFNEVIILQEFPILETPCNEDFEIIHNWFLENIMVN